MCRLQPTGDVGAPESPEAPAWAGIQLQQVYVEAEVAAEARFTSEYFMRQKTHRADIVWRGGKA